MTAAELDLRRTLLDEPHHDGSDVYVLKRPDALGDEAVVRIRVSQPVEAVVLRYVENGEPRSSVAGEDGEG
jgi:alpha-glucosidase